MITRRHYIAISQMFSNNRPSRKASFEVKELWQVLQRDMADILELDDSRFDRGEFSAACEAGYAEGYGGDEVRGR
ncbi:MAG: hypothetical protein MN733_09375 [Nitrososphaera sp.]|nr:hypothetical protein [Nitrososphaera sp.]